MPPPPDDARAPDIGAGEPEHLSTEGQMPFLEHLAELRTRIFHILAGVLVGFILCYVFVEHVYEYLLMPLRAALPEGASPIGTGVAEAFLTKLKIGFLGGIVAASPWIIYQVWKFIAPALYPHERRWVVPIVFFATAFFLSGVAFGYIVVFPLGFEFFVDEFASIDVAPQIRISEYLSFAAKLLLAFGLAFELPIAALILGRLGLIDTHFLLTKGKYALLVIFILAAMLTPPDFVSQVLLAIPLVLLYGVSVGLVALFGAKRAAPEAE